MMRSTQTRGFTLLELAVVLAITSIFVGSVLKVTMMGTNMYSIGTRQGQIQADGRRALDQMAKELRLADRDTAQVTTENGAGRVDFRVPVSYAGGAVAWSSMITYNYELSRVDANQNGIVDEGDLVRTQGGLKQIVCHYIPQGGIILTKTNNSVAIQLKLLVANWEGRTLTTDVDTSILLRNHSLPDPVTP